MEAGLGVHGCLLTHAPTFFSKAALISFTVSKSRSFSRSRWLRPRGDVFLCLLCAAGILPSCSSIHRPNRPYSGFSTEVAQQKKSWKQQKQPVLFC